MRMSAVQGHLGVAATGRRRGARYFFVGLGVFAVALTLITFVPTYLAFESGKMPIAGVVQFHGLLMSLWLATFLTQAVLAATGRISLHRKFGSLGVALGVAVWASMVFVEIRSSVVNPPGSAKDLDWMLPGVYCYTTFPLFLGWAVWLRHAPAWHKRFMVIALFIALQAVEQRMAWLPHSLVGYWTDFAYIDVCLFAALVAYDLTTTKRVHTATITGAATLLLAQVALLIAWGTQGWHHVAIDAVQMARATF
jgi:hypothetical protein